MSRRDVYKIILRPVIGSRFQPTGFPDLGPAVFRRAAVGQGSRDALLVESVQSMANRAEATTWDEATNEQVAACDGLPYLRIVDADGTFLTSSRLEPHRLASAYVMEGRTEGQDGAEWLKNAFGLVSGRPIDYREIAAAVFALDPLSLIHGVFFARKGWAWQPKIARALTCFIEAYGVEAAVSGGVKRDSVNPEGGNTDTGYGMVPYQRTEYTAAEIKALVSVDLDQLRAYGLGESREEVLRAIVDFEVATLFSGGLRLRTACDLEVADVEGADLPQVQPAVDRLRAAISAVADLVPERREIVWTARKGRS